MRKIKFRAKAIANNKHSGIAKGDWVYGCYIESGCDAPCIIFGDGEQIEIDKATLGQFTGMLTDGGQEIYEGDTFKDEVCLSPDGISSAHNNFHWIKVDCVIQFIKGAFVGVWEVKKQSSTYGEYLFTNRHGSKDINIKSVIPQE